MTYTPPCRAPENNPDDWFIAKDGKQYPDDDFLTAAEISQISKSVLPREDETSEAHRDRVEAAIEAANRGRRRDALRDRRNAKDACFGCYVRVHCMAQALENSFEHGTWGGHYEEELRKIRALQRATTTT